jgi:microcystin-dependent protein
MGLPYFGQLLLGAWGFAPKGYSACNGQLLQISQNQQLFSLLGTTYGGDGRVTFALPNLQGRTPIGFSGAFPQGSSGGEDFHTLTVAEVPPHTHQLRGSGAAPSSFNPATAMFATSSGTPKLYAAPSSLVAMNAGTISTAGGSQSHENRQPFLVMNWVIALTGIFPTRN